MKTSVMRTQSAATIYIDGKKFVFTKEHPNFDAALLAAKNKEWDKIPTLIDVADALKAISPKVEIRPDGTGATYDGAPIPTGYVIENLTKGGDPRPLERFLERWTKNPSRISQEEAVAFFNKAKLPLTPEGLFYAWKVVRADYTDKHTGRFDNSVGQVLEMPRENVDDNRERTCSYGFHVCARSYIGQFGTSSDRLMKVVVDPADIVSIPTDHNEAKMRVCRYKVVAEVEWGAYDKVDAFEEGSVRRDPDDLSARSARQAPTPVPGITINTAPVPAPAPAQKGWRNLWGLL